MDFSSIQILAYLSGSWVDLSADILLSGGINVSYGIRGNGPTDILANVGQMTFRLSNRTGKYYPNGSSPLTGWDYGAKVKLVLQYSDSTNQYTRFTGRVGKLDFVAGPTANEAYVTVTAYDWFNEAQKYPLLAPSIEVNKTADYGIDALADLMPIQPDNRSLETGDTTFLTIFDSAGMRTTAYAEIAKLVNSEWGYCYITHVGGETLVFEAGSHRGASHAVKTVPSISDHLLLETGDLLLLETGEPFPIHTTGDAALTGGMSNLRLAYGDGIVNYFTITAYPKRVDTDTQILYQLDNPLPIMAGETITFRAGYKDQTGGGAKVSAIVSSMLTPEVPGAVDTTIVSLMNFDSATDETGRVWTNGGDVSFENDVFVDGFGVTRLSGSINGKYGVFGGYADYELYTAGATDLDFGAGAFTIGWYEARINPGASQHSITRGRAIPYPPFLLGASDGTSLRIYMSSSGTAWDIANGVSMGEISTSRWVHYEVSRDTDGWFYSFADGKLIEKWYSSLSLYSTTDDLALAHWGPDYAYTMLDMLYIHNGKCLHRSNFEPPKFKTLTLPGDYLLNSASDGTGTDYSADLAITATYDSAGVNYTLENTGANDAWLIYLTARGSGVYQYNPIEASAESATSQNTYGYKNLYLQQRQQQTVSDGLARASVVITNEAAPLTEVSAVSLYANYSYLNMQFFLLVDVGDLVEITHAPSGTSSAQYFVNSVDFTINDRAAQCTYGLRANFAT